MTKVLLWIGSNFLWLLFMGLVVWALVIRDYESARFLVLMSMMLAINDSVGRLRREVRDRGRAVP